MGRGIFLSLKIERTAIEGSLTPFFVKVGGIKSARASNTVMNK